MAVTGSGRWRRRRHNCIRRLVAFLFVDFFFFLVSGIVFPFKSSFFLFAPYAWAFCFGVCVAVFPSNGNFNGECRHFSTVALFFWVLFRVFLRPWYGWVFRQKILIKIQKIVGDLLYMCAKYGLILVIFSIFLSIMKMGNISLASIFFMGLICWYRQVFWPKILEKIQKIVCNLL